MGRGMNVRWGRLMELRTSYTSHPPNKEKGCIIEFFYACHEGGMPYWYIYVDSGYMYEEKIESCLITVTFH